DFVNGLEQNLLSIQKFGYPQDKIAAIGLVDGRNIWISYYAEKLALVEQISTHIAKERIWLQSSCSLLHVPVSAKQETALPAELREALAFAEEKLDEIVWLSQAAAADQAAVIS